MDTLMGIKEMYDINIRLNSAIKIGDRQYDINETILNFEKAEIAQIQEGVARHAAMGGYNNNLLITWDVDKEMSFVISNGILSPASWAILSNSKIKMGEKKSISYNEKIKLIEDGDSWYCFLKYLPNHINGKWGVQGNPEGEQLPMGRREWLPLKPLPPSKDKFIFCYDADTGRRIMNFDICGNKIIFKAEHREVIIDYTFDYLDQHLTLQVGNRLLNGFLNLTAKITTKDYESGEPRTAILQIPRLKLTSDLIANLGEGQDCATVSDFYFVGYPEEGRLAEQTAVCSITFLPTELTGDYL